MAPRVLLGAAKEQVFGQCPPKAERSLLLLGVLGLLKGGLDHQVTRAPGVGDVLQLRLQCLEAVLGAWEGRERRRRERLKYGKRNLAVRKMSILDLTQQ